MKLEEEVFEPMSFKTAKACVAVFSATIAFGVLQARAQPGKAAAQASAQASRVPIDLPMTAPREWGLSAEQWAGLRQSCQTIADKMAAKQPLTTGEASDRGLCIKYSYGRVNVPAAPPQVPEYPAPNVAPPRDPSA